MVTKFYNFPVPKKGKLRSVLKRPATLKTKAWKKVDYVRTQDAVPFIRQDRGKWKRSLTQILTATPRSLAAMLREDGLLHDWEGATCPHCGKGTVGKLAAPQDASGVVKYRCSESMSQIYQPTSWPPTFCESLGLFLDAVGHPSSSSSICAQSSP